MGWNNEVWDDPSYTTREELDAAEEGSRQAQAAKDAYEARLSGAREEAAQIISEAKGRAQAAYDARLSQAQADAKQVLSDAQAQAEAQREAVLCSARDQVASLALLAASKAAGRALDGEDDRALVSAFLAEVGEQA